ncbi:unnamed protein product, partial [Closterium sp. NIES-53]
MNGGRRRCMLVVDCFCCRSLAGEVKLGQAAAGCPVAMFFPRDEQWEEEMGG